MILDLGEGFSLRQATEADHPALSLICLQTGDAGKDATAREDDPTLLGLVFAIPYQVLEPALAFMLDGPSGACGYLLGARDTRAFNFRLTREWYPQLQRRVSDAPAEHSSWTGSDWSRYLIHHPESKVPTALDPYPSHGHIDLLPEARGRGIGRQLMGFLAQRLAELGSRGLHLQVDPHNRNATRFYNHLGFATLRAPDLPRHSLYVAKSLLPAT